MKRNFVAFRVHELGKEAVFSDGGFGDHHLATGSFYAAQRYGQIITTIQVKEFGVATSAEPSSALGS